MLGAYEVDFKKAWDEWLALIEFSCNNSYHASIAMASMRGRLYRTPLCYQAINKALTIGPDLIQVTTEKIRVIQEWMTAAQSRQKSYVDKRRKPLEFEVGD